MSLFYFRTTGFPTTSWREVGKKLNSTKFEIRSETWLGLVVFDELDVFNGPCQTDSLVAYLDWHMDWGYLGDDLLPICLQGTVRSAWASSVWCIYRTTKQMRETILALLKGLYQSVYQKIQHFRRWQGFSPRPNKLGLLRLMEYYCYYWHTTAAVSMLYQFNSTKKETEKAIKKDGFSLLRSFSSASIFLTNLCLISCQSSRCPPKCLWQSHVSLLDVQSHLGYPKNVDGRR